MAPFARIADDQRVIPIVDRRGTTIQEFLMKAAEDDARRAGERNRLLGEALRVRAVNRAHSRPRAAAALTRLGARAARSAVRISRFGSPRTAGG